MSVTTTLSESASDRCQIVSVNLQGVSAHRLKALGIFEGQEVRLAKRGNPLIVKAAGGKIAIAVDIANQIVVVSG